MTSAFRPASPPVALLLDLDPELGAGVWPEDWAAARRACQGELLTVPQGRWIPPKAWGERNDIFGMLIVEGDPSPARGTHATDRCDGYDSRRARQVLHPGGGAVAKPAGIGAAPFGGPTRASRPPGTDRAPATAADRLLLTLWHLAERSGHVTPKGTVLPLWFGHEVLGQLSAARRSTATLALQALTIEDAVHRLDDGSWLLTPVADRRIEAIMQTGHLSPTLGTQLTVRRTPSQTWATLRAMRTEGDHIRAHPHPTAPDQRA